jgi:hypothetical protein
MLAGRRQSTACALEAQREEMMDRRNILIVLFFALVGWALCFATMGIGMAVTTLDIARVIHASAAPISFFLVFPGSILPGSALRPRCRQH